MTDHEVLDLMIDHRHPPVRARGIGFEYDGWVIATAIKRSGGLRVIVEDGDGRIFIHNANELDAKA